jgi:hypothetical protein
VAALPDAQVAGTSSADEAVSETSDGRPVYPYSVIPGGAPTVDVLRQAINTDPVVRVHYANFNLARTHVVRLRVPRVAHVSYRLGNAVYWTKRAVVLKVGETVLTDGRHFAEEIRRLLRRAC